MNYCTPGRSGLCVSRLTLDDSLSALDAALPRQEPGLMKHPIEKRLSSGLTALGFIALISTALPVWSQGTASSPSPQTFSGTMKHDLRHRARDIHWPEGFRPETADLFSHNEATLQASCKDVWNHIVDATRWPEWYPNSKGVSIVGGSSLTEGTVFHWTTFGLPLESKVNEFVPYSRIGWYGYAPGTLPDAAHSFYHTWFLVPAGTACRVVTDEVGKGPDAAHLRETDESLMHRGHDLWLATLKWVSENR
jgi:polyketide cyclase/dehydrase/lipid transport protein